MINAGTVLLHKDFAFKDGGSADKLLVVLGLDNATRVVAKTTSQGKRYRIDHGCQAGNYFPAFLLTVGCCFLNKNTWVCLSEFYDLSARHVTDKLVAGELYRIGQLDTGLTRDVQVCATNCDDITPFQDSLIRACFA